MSVSFDNAKLKAARAQSGLTREALAHRAGVPYASLQRYENSPKADPSFSVVARVAHELGVSLDDLIRAA